MPARKTKKLYQRYDIVRARTSEELIRLVNIKNRQGWECQGGVSQGNVLEKDFPFSQAIVRLEEIGSTSYRKPIAKKAYPDDRIL